MNKRLSKETGPAHALLRQVGYGRILVGVTCYVAPRLAARAMLLRGDDPGRDYLARLFGTREAVLGAAQATGVAVDGTTLLRVAVAIDLLDTLGAVGLGLRGRLPAATAAYVATVSGVTAATGLAVLAAGRRRRNSAS